MTEFSIEHEKNYAPQVVRIPEPVKAQNSDRLYTVTVLGYPIIVDESWKDKAGDLAVFFPAEAQISQELAWFANLNSDGSKNANPEEKGYLGKNRRVRAIKLRGNVSSALMLPLHVVAGFAGYETPKDDFFEGLTFDTINGLELSRKYVLPEKPVNQSAGQKKIKAAFKRVDEKVFPMHIDTDHWLRNEFQIQDDDVLIVTQKLHGSSVRIGNVPVKVKHTWLEKLAAKLGVRIRETEFDKVGGSRKVIKDPNNPDQAHYYSTDIWTETLMTYGDVLPQNVIVYGELVGFTPDGAPIQKGYTYDAEHGQMRLYVYRVSVVTEDGGLYDLSWDQVRNFCDTRGLNYTPELWRGFKRDFSLGLFDEKNFHEEDGVTMKPIVYPDTPVKLSAGGTGRDEGIVIRVDRGDTVPALFKYKFASFLAHETEDLDAQEESGEAGIEA